MSVQDEFVSTVSHELRTPLTSIRGFSQTLLNSWDKIDDENKQKFIKIIEEQSNRLINLVENILTVSRENSFNYVFTNVNVNNLIDKILPIFTEQYKEHNIIFNKLDKLPNARLDSDKFQQIITNLVDNACKYSPKGSSVTISTKYLEDEIVISVEDNGVGIDKSDYDKLFKKFSRLENHLTSKTQGNGLGLYITKNIIEKMNGNISFESEINKGTIFYVKFPVYNPEEVLKCSQES